MYIDDIRFSLNRKLPVRRLFRNITEIEKLSELGVLFLLFEMGLELSLDRLKVLHDVFVISFAHQNVISADVSHHRASASLHLCAGLPLCAFGLRWRLTAAAGLLAGPGEVCLWAGPHPDVPVHPGLQPVLAAGWQGHRHPDPGSGASLSYIASHRYARVCTTCLQAT